MMDYQNKSKQTLKENNPFARKATAPKSSPSKVISKATPDKTRAPTMKRLAVNATDYFLQFGYYVTALRPLPLLPLLNLIYRLCWLTILFGLIFLMFYLRLNGGDVSIGGLVGTALFVSNAIVYMVCIVEVICKHCHYRKLCQLQREVDELTARHLRGVTDLRIQREPIMLCLLPLLIVQYICDGLKIWIHKRSYISPVFWPSIMVVQGLRMRYIQIIGLIMETNQRVALLKQSLRFMVRHNKPKAKYTSDIWMPYAAWEYDQVNVQRLLYGRIFEIYQALNEGFGWSILAIFLTSFFDFVCNAFWSFAASQSIEPFDKFIYNGGTTIALGSLVWMLFWCTDVSSGNAIFKISFITIATIVSMPAHGYFLRLARSRSRFYRLAYILLQLGLWLFAFTPYFVKFPLLNTLYSCLWVVGIFVISFAAFYHHPPKDQLSLVSMVSLILFLTQMTMHLVILLDSCTTKSQRAAVRQRFAHIELRMRLGSRIEKNASHQDVQDEKLTWYLARQILAIVALLTICHLVVSWATLQMSGSAYGGIGLYWYSLPSALALQFKILEFFTGIVCLNRQLETVRQRLNDIGERNFCTILRPSLNMREWIRMDDGAGEGVSQLKILKSEYCELFVIFRLFNVCYGWSLLAFAAMYFIDLVCNSFWICLALITQGRDPYALVRSGGFVLIVFVFLSVLCWHCQKSSDHSRHIGCIIFKLVKPLGNKRYNDLLSEFSLQVLHQQFVITAKEFFNLNLNLLGSMVAAIVTYLVILIQFMISESSNTKKSLTTIAPVIFNNVSTVNKN